MTRMRSIEYQNNHSLLKSFADIMKRGNPIKTILLCWWYAGGGFDVYQSKGF